MSGFAAVCGLGSAGPPGEYAPRVIRVQACDRRPVAPSGSRARTALFRRRPSCLRPGVGVPPPSELGTRLVSWPNKTASSIAPTAITASTSSELVPAPASTAGMVNTPVPMMLPITSPVAEVSPRARAFAHLSEIRALPGPRAASAHGDAWKSGTSETLLPGAVHAAGPLDDVSYCYLGDGRNNTGQLAAGHRCPARARPAGPVSSAVGVGVGTGPELVAEGRGARHTRRGGGCCGMAAPRRG